MVNIVKLRLSGSNDKLYEYLWDYNMEPQVYVTQGIRAVVPSKIKDDGSLSLAIGTVEEVLMNMHEDYLDPSIQYKHVVCFISPHAMNVAERRMKELGKLGI